MAELDQATTQDTDSAATLEANEVADTTNVENDVDTGAADTDDEGNAGDDDLHAHEVDAEEVELDGVKYSVPKEVKRAILRKEDYTRKTQEIADVRKGLDQREQQLNQHAEVQKATLSERVQLANIESELDTYGKVDWGKLHSEDPALHTHHTQRQNDLRYQLQVLKGQIADKESKALETQRASRAKQAQDSEAVIARDIKDWGPAKAEQFVSLGETVAGMPRQAVVDALVAFPGAAKILELALVGQQLRAKQSQTQAQPKPTPKAPVKAATVVGRAKATTPSLEDMPMSDFYAARNKQEQQARRKTT
jgi:hypothetical protein